MLKIEKLIIRKETAADYAIVESITREAFWNLYVPGCDEHYVAHIIRRHEDFIPELDFVAELNGEVIGSVMYTKAKLIDEAGQVKSALTFGPVCIHPKHQHRGYGKKLLQHSFNRAMELGYDTIVIFGDPANYVSLGFKSCKKFNVCTQGNIYPASMLVKELKPGSLNGTRYYYHESPAFNIDSTEAQKFDENFEAKEKKDMPCQEKFYIMSHSVIQ